MNLQHLTFIDVETTGLSPSRDRIIEIGLLRMENGTITNTFSSLINPGGTIPPEITLLTGITSEQIEDAPSFSSMAGDIQKLLEHSVFVAHNARFDYSFIKAEFERLGISFSSQLLCTARLSRKLYPRFRRHNLDAIIERFGISCDMRHRAFSDAQVLSEFYTRIQKQFDAQILTDAIMYVTKTSSLPGAISKDMIDALPESAGVYIFYGKDGQPLYIGKSVNIKNRVRSHFYDYAHSGKEAKIFQTIESIETIPTSGELGALLLESYMIKTRMPLYNRMLRHSNTMLALFQTTTPEGYFAVEQKLLSEISIEELHTVIAVFRTKRQMKDALIELAQTHKLCQKLLGIEKTKGRCFGSQIELCHGACTGKELPAKYNMRFTEAFYKTRIRQWPFPGAIAIREGNEAHVVYKWCYMGTTHDMIEGTISDTTHATFDYDAYKILSAHLLKKLHDKTIHHLPKITDPTSDTSTDQFSDTPLSTQIPF